MRQWLPGERPEEAELFTESWAIWSWWKETVGLLDMAEVRKTRNAAKHTTRHRTAPNHHGVEAEFSRSLPQAQGLKALSAL